jgi:predicted AlkP superfamily phosphohydrolase/phosphomutase
MIHNSVVWYVYAKMAMIEMPIKNKTGAIGLASLLILAYSFLSCSKSHIPRHTDLAEYFAHYPIIGETNRIIFGEEKYQAFLLDGWASPKNQPKRPFLWATGIESSLQIFFQNRRDYSMNILYRAQGPGQMKVLINGNQAGVLEIQKGQNDRQIELPKNSILTGLNQITFVHHSGDFPENRNNRISFQQVDFMPLGQSDPPGIQISIDSQMVKLQGPLQCLFFFRSYQNSRLVFRYRNQGNYSPGDRLKLDFEDFQGRTFSHEIPIESGSWRKESINLASFPNRVVKVAIQHLTARQSTTEIKKPLLKWRVGNQDKTKIVILGLDGATWNVISPLMKQGKLPNFKRLIKGGVSGRLRTVRPIYSPLIWTSMLTGKTKEKHGITGYLDQQQKKGEIIPNSRLNRKCLALWNILSSQGLLVGIVGPWVTWPAESVNGFLLSDRIYFENLSATTYPPELKDTLRHYVKPRVNPKKNPYMNEIDNMLSNDIGMLRSPLQSNVEQERVYLQQDELKCLAGSFFNGLFDPDFFFLYLRGPDVTSHFFWKYYEPDTTVPSEEIQKFQNMIPSLYCYQDLLLGKYLDSIDKKTTLLVVSDHGMARKSYGPEIDFGHINKLWKKIGIFHLLKRTTRKAQRLILTPKNRSDQKTVMSELSKLKLGNLENPLFRISLSGKSQSINLEFQNLFLLDGHADVYSEKTKIGELEEYCTIKEISGDHTLHGILIMKGPGIKKSRELRQCSVLDIAPTALYILGLPVAHDMDGQILKEAFTEEFIKKNPIQSVQTYESIESIRDLSPKRLKSDQEVEKELLKRLRSLGYIK